ncbi:helix-turn-helix domain-containing protein [Nocardioides sp. MAH-18]|uniref:Helix-turn-helix domain-containing protein n=1 Tax=Nocardioides agri TaxID=2682843 RepID=A0A6L6XUR4_9ACTN|nr:MULTISPECIES: helix-turn-helix domain-containing protein [unclassified Nocardioides]MBA2956093.1 AraC family transcriptional regulator [Nocardioides sp. CGMCC 1.13656]MVQ50939.1 helix-turn-helix domain-containing protein [Nocardioides sp. MAH-18]
MTEVFVSRDVGASEALLREHYSAMRVRPTDGRHLLRMDQRRLGRLRLDQNTFGMTLEVEAAPLGAVVVARVLAGTASYGRGHDERRYRRGDLYVTADPDEGFCATLDDFQGAIAVLDPSLLDEIAEPSPGAGSTVRLVSLDPSSASAADLWWRTYCFVRDSTDAAGSEALSPIFEQEARRLLGAATVAAFPSTADVEPTIEDRRDAHTRTLRRAAQFIEANAWRDITIKEIAEAAGVTIRTVQLSFRRHLDTTPTAYLRGVRLQYIHDELVANDPARTTVSEVASRWGFCNFGRFAAQYRTQFGELPAHTLRH